MDDQVDALGMAFQVVKNGDRPVTIEQPLWLAVGANPADALPRLVLADWLDENAAEVECPKCEGSGQYWDGKGMWEGAHIRYRCTACHGTGRVSDGRAEMAEALRATADRVSRCFVDAWGWNRLASFPPQHQRSGTDQENVSASLPDALFTALTGHYLPVKNEWWRDYPTAADAIRDLCRAWVKVHKGVSV